MSETATQEQPAVDPTAVIFERVHKQAFLEKIAQVAPAFLPQNEQQLNELLMIGDALQAAAYNEEQEKVASGSPFAGPLAALNSTLSEAGVKTASDAVDTNRLLAIGSALANDPEIFDAALAIKIAQAEAAEAAYS